MSEQQPNVLLGVCGSIAAWRMPEVASRLHHQGHEVRPVMTRSAQEFVTPAALAMMSKNHVYLYNQRLSNGWEPTHIELARWTDIAVLAPATASMIGKLAYGLAEGLIAETFVALPNDTPKYIAPAMNCHMLEDPAVQRNIDQLRRDGYEIIEPRTGELACGDTGNGKIAATVDIIAAIQPAVEEIITRRAGDGRI